MPATPEQNAAIEANILASALQTGAPDPAILNLAIRETDCTVGQVAGIMQRVSTAIHEKKNAEAQARHAGIQSGTITDNGAADGKTLIVHRKFSEVYGRPHPKQFVTGDEPVLSIIDRTSKEFDESLEEIFNSATSRQKRRYRAAHHPDMRQNTVAITGASPQTQGITIPADLTISIADNVIAELPWTMSDNVFRTGSSEGVMGYTTAVDIDPNTEAETVDGITFGIIGEGADSPETVIPKLVEIKGTTKTMTASAIITRRMRKANPQIANWFIAKLARAHVAIMIRKQVRGLAPFPIGFLNQSFPDFAPILVDRQTSGTVTSKDLRQMRNEIPEPFRGSTMWVTREKTWDALLDEKDDTGRMVFQLTWQDTAGPIGREQGKLGMPVTFSRHMPLLGSTGDVCAINPGSLWTALRDDTMEILTSDQILVKSGGFYIGVFSDVGWGVMPGGYHRGIIALKTK